jgi:hypothetical protein
MKARQTSLIALVAALLAAAPAAAAAPPDVTTLFTRAVQIVHSTDPPTYSRAVMLEADGATRGGRRVSSASGIVSWQFFLDNQSTPSSPFRSVSIRYGPAPARFGKVKGNRSPFLEDVAITKAPKMTLTQAVALMRRAGIRDGFFNVVLRNPLGPRATNPQYIFGVGRAGFVSVNTVTKKVVRLAA